MDTIKMNIAIGVISAFLSNLPLIPLVHMHKRKMVTIKSEAQVRRRMKLWKIQDMALAILGALYAFLCVTFVCSFLANVSNIDGLKWAFTAVISIVKQQLLVPIGIAMTLAGFELCLVKK